jgi:hypothetical protein
MNVPSLTAMPPLPLPLTAYRSPLTTLASPDDRQIHRPPPAPRRGLPLFHRGSGHQGRGFQRLADRKLPIGHRRGGTLVDDASGPAGLDLPRSWGSPLACRARRGGVRGMSHALRAGQSAHDCGQHHLSPVDRAVVSPGSRPMAAQGAGSAGGPRLHAGGGTGIGAVLRRWGAASAGRWRLVDSAG